MNTAHLHPKFVEAMEAIKRLPEDHPASFNLFIQAFRHAPEELKRDFHQKALELGLIPESTHVDREGGPVFSDIQIAKHFGVPVEEIRQQIEHMMDTFGDEGIVNGPIFRKQ